MTVVRSDDAGLYIRTGGYVFRPGSVLGYGHAYRMDDGGLVDGDKVVSRHVGGTELARVILPDGTVTRWHAEGGSRDRGLQEPPADAEWDEKGQRLFEQADTTAPMPRTARAVSFDEIDIG